MTNDADAGRFEYPDSAGYPDGSGFLDEGTTDDDEGTTDPDEGTADPDADAGRPADDDDAVDDEETAALVDEVNAEGARDIDLPSAESDHAIVVRRVDERNRFVATLDDVEIATLRYAEEGDGLVLITTRVEPGYRGRGIAGAFIADVLDRIRDDDVRITVQCPVVSAFIARNEEYADLLA
ncbi:GNAT family N-acetyltransferase [Agromyces sp. SYSU T0242]|uniref:GNAT family N-acetyltransferase n=1 Tax=Agromyces litoreus TaxID=3158561 RepID=UPI00339146D7